MIVVLLVGLFASVDVYTKNSEQYMHEEVVARRYVTDILEEKNKKLTALKARETELLNSIKE
jgi:hypothetical protein